MTKLIQAPNLSTGWIDALEHLLLYGGKDTNVIVEIEHIGVEDTRIRQLLDSFLAELSEYKKKEKIFPVTTVANTLFPQALYHPERGEKARSFLYETSKESFVIKQRLPANRYGTYFQRMIAWSTQHGEINQIETIIQKLRAGLCRPNPLSSVYEIGLTDVKESDADASGCEEARIYQPGSDRRLMGFPCLSHISFTLFKRRLHLTALYRNQHFIRKAYGNFLGLSYLLSFLCYEVGCEPGELVCIASHADAEFQLGKCAITALIQQCKPSLLIK